MSHCVNGHDPWHDYVCRPLFQKLRHKSLLFSVCVSIEQNLLAIEALLDLSCAKEVEAKLEDQNVHSRKKTKRDNFWDED